MKLEILKTSKRSNVFSFQKPFNQNYKTSEIKKQLGDGDFLKKIGVSSE